MTYEYKTYQGYSEIRPDVTVKIEAFDERGAVIKTHALLMRRRDIPFGTDRKLIKVQEVINSNQEGY